MTYLLKKLAALEFEVRRQCRRSTHKVETVTINAGDPRPPRGEGVTLQIVVVIVDPPADQDDAPFRDRYRPEPSQITWDPIAPSPPSSPSLRVMPSLASVKLGR